jgi:hypothetical protein
VTPPSQPRAPTSPAFARRTPNDRRWTTRHSFASLLLHEGRSVIYVARQLGHNARYTLGTYGHVIDDLDDQPRISAEDATRDARSTIAERRVV